MKYVFKAVVILSFLFFVSCGAADDRMNTHISGPENNIYIEDEKLSAEEKSEANNSKASNKRQSLAEIYKEYISKNAAELSLDTMDSDLKRIDFENYNTIFIGESHGVGRNDSVKMSFLKYLNQNFKIRYLIEESGYCGSIIINQFLQTGNEELIIDLMNSHEKTYSYSNEKYNFYIDLYQYNQSLPEKEKIKVIGIDIQHNVAYGRKVLSSMEHHNKEKPDAVQKVFDLITSGTGNGEELIININSAMDMVEVNSDIFKEYFGRDYMDFYFGLLGIKQAEVFYRSKNFASREAYILENFSQLFMELEIDKCFGMFGSIHVFLDHGFLETKALANYLNTEFEPTKNKVLSINCIYHNCEYLDPLTGVNTVLSSPFSAAFSKPFAETISGDYGICPSGELIFENKPLSEKFQYMLCIKGSSPNTFFNKQPLP